jgi:hypothetical protein
LAEVARAGVEVAFPVVGVRVEPHGQRGAFGGAGGCTGARDAAGEAGP